MLYRPNLTKVLLYILLNFDIILPRSPFQLCYKIELHGFYTNLSCARETSPLATQQAGYGERKLWKMTAENMLLHDVRRFRKDEANLIPIPMEDEAREHF
ncbi:hypothetical protein D3C78_941970 [compost metagenome]